MKHLQIIRPPYTPSHGLAFEETSVSHQISMMMIALIKATAIFVMAAAALGLILTWRRYRQQSLVVYLLLAFIIGQNVIFYSDMRFRAPIEPMLLLLAGGAFWWLMQHAPRFFTRTGVAVIFLRRVRVGQGEGKPRPYHTRASLANSSYGRGEACPRPGISRRTCPYPCRMLYCTCGDCLPTCIIESQKVLDI